MKKIFAIVLGAALMLSATNAFAQLSVGAGWLNTTEMSCLPVLEARSLKPRCEGAKLPLESVGESFLALS